MTFDELCVRFPRVEFVVLRTIARLLSTCRSIDALLIVYDALHAAGAEDILDDPIYARQVMDLAMVCAERARELPAEEVHV